MWALSRPVAFHWAMNFGCERFAIAFVTSIVTGMVTSAISASSGEITNITVDHADDREQRRDELAQRLLQALRDVVDVVGDPAEQLAARLRVDVGQRQPVELVVDVGAQLAHGALHHVVEQVTLQPRQHARGDVDERAQQQHGAERAEVDADARDGVRAQQQVGEVAVAACARGGDRLVRA